jgi:hypothetical protein
MKVLNSINFVNYIFRIYNRLNINNKSRPIACPLLKETTRCDCFLFHTHKIL